MRDAPGCAGARALPPSASATNLVGPGLRSCDDDRMVKAPNAPRRLVVRIVLQTLVVGLAVYLVWPLLGGFEKTGEALLRGL